MSITYDLETLPLGTPQYNNRAIDQLYADCLADMVRNGIPFADQIQADGTIHRFSIDHKKNQKDEWYIAFEGVSIKGNPFLICIYDSWSNPQKHEFKSWQNTNSFDEEEREHLHSVLREKRESSEKKLQEEREEAALEAQKIWAESYETPLSEEHFAYLKLKQVKPIGVRFGLNLKGFPSVIIPLRNIKGEIRSLQFISLGTKGKAYKTFLTGGEIKGNFFVLGEISNGKSFGIAEGYATAASIHEAVEIPVVVAFGSHNLSPTIENLRNAYPQSKIIIFADDDQETKNGKGDSLNSGKAKAKEAAEKYCCSCTFPEFPENFRLPNDGKRPTDFNDLHVHFGIDAVKKQLESILSDQPWPDPKPITTELFPVSPFDFEKLLPKELRDYVRDEADRMPCAPDFIAAALIVALGSIVGARCAILPKGNDDWAIVPNLWGGCVGVPTSKKSPAIDKGMRPLYQLAKKAMEKHREATDAYEADKVVYEAKKEAIEARIKNTAKAKKKSADDDENIEKIAKELQVHRKEVPNVPIQRRFKTNDTTIEKLGEMLRENPQGMLVLRDELVGLLASWDKAGREGDRAFFLESWNGVSDFNTDRIGRKDIYIPNLCVSIFGGIQPDKLIRYLEQTANALENDGMLQRFQILVYPNPPEWEWRDRTPDKEAQKQVDVVFDTLTDIDPVDWGAYPKNNHNKFPYFRFDEEAQQIFINWSSRLHKEKLQREDNPIISQHLAKYDKLFPALVLIFHLVDCAIHGNRGSIKKESALRAEAWCDYLESHARRCYGLLADDGLRAAQALSTKIQNSKVSNNFTCREVRRNQWRYLTTDEAVRSALEWLEDEKWIQGYTTGSNGPGTGRSTTRYIINPKIQKGKLSNTPEDQEANEEMQNFGND